MGPESFEDTDIIDPMKVSPPVFNPTVKLMPLECEVEYIGFFPEDIEFVELTKAISQRFRL